MSGLFDVNDPAEKVIRLVIGPLNILCDAQISDARAEVYIDILGNQQEATLEDAVSHLTRTWTQTRVPPPASVLAACNTTGFSPAQRAKGSEPWKEKGKRINEAVEAYLVHFKSGVLYTEARREGWEYHLARLVEGLAQIQAQIIHKANGVSYSSWDLGESRWQNGAETKALIRESVEQGRAGHIEVLVPAAAIEYLQGQEQPETYGTTGTSGEALAKTMKPRYYTPRGQDVDYTGAPGPELYEEVTF